MGVVKGAISIKDNMSVVLRSIKEEQTAFRKDVEKTKSSLQSTWDQKRTARLDATAAKKTADSLVKKLEPLKKKVTTAVALKDMVTAKVKAVGVWPGTQAVYLALALHLYLNGGDDHPDGLPTPTRT